MWENIGYHKNKIFAIILLSVMGYSMIVNEEDLEDPYTLTVDYDCREIVRDPSDIPKDIIEQCKILVRELEMKNALKESKRITAT